MRPDTAVFWRTFRNSNYSPVPASRLGPNRLQYSIAACPCSWMTEPIATRLHESLGLWVHILHLDWCRYWNGGWNSALPSSEAQRGHWTGCQRPAWIIVWADHHMQHGRLSSGDWAPASFHARSHALRADRLAMKRWCLNMPLFPCSKSSQGHSTRTPYPIAAACRPIDRLI